MKRPLIIAAILVLILTTCTKDYNFTSRPVEHKVRGFGDPNGPVMIYYDYENNRLEIYFHKSYAGNGGATDYYYYYMLDSNSWSEHIIMQDLDSEWVYAYVSDTNIRDGTLIFRLGGDNTDAIITGSSLFTLDYNALIVSIFGLGP